MKMQSYNKIYKMEKINNYMKEKRGLKELLKNNFMSLVFVMVLILAGAVIAGNVIVKEGNIEVEENINVSGNITVTGTGTASTFIANQVAGKSKLGSFGIGAGESGVWIDYGSGVANAAIIQAESQGVDYRNLLLNPYGAKVGIRTTNPAYPLQVGSGTDNSTISIYSSGNISAAGYITRTSVYDKSQGSALDKIKDASEYLNPDGTINHATLFGYVTYPHEYCTQNEKNETICETITEEGDILDDEVALLKQAVYELRGRLDEVCQKDSSYSWC